MNQIPAIVRFRGRWSLLCNFHPAPVAWQGITYPTSEHAFNAGKTFDAILRRRIALAPTPQVAKRLGRRYPLRPDWDIAVRYDVMREVLHAKFTQHPFRRELLLSTGEAHLTEGNTWHDQHWGNCTCGIRPACDLPGLNYLGRMLMQLRDELRRQP
jgi:ribA/ribD-fused uncharacterized protein